jgi:hypothetical protein
LLSGTGKKVHSLPSPFYFKPKAYLLQASILQASSSLLFGACGVADYMGGRGLAVRQKVTGASQIPKKQNGQNRHTTPGCKKKDYLTYNRANFRKGKRWNPIP